MNTIRIRKAKSGDGFKFKFRFMEEKRDITLTEARDFAKNKKTVFEPSKNLSDGEFLLGKNIANFSKSAPMRKIRKGNRKTSVPRSKVREAVMELPKAEFKPTTAKAVTKIVVKPKKVADAVIKLPKEYKVDKNKLPKDSFDVHSRVGSQKVLEGEQLILVVLRKAAKPLTASEIGKRIFKNELNTKGIEFVVEVRGFKFYAYLNKHYTPMVNKKLVKVVGLAKGHRKMEKLWEAINV